jgi:hypothetical protein
LNELFYYFEIKIGESEMIFADGENIDNSSSMDQPKSPTTNFRLHIDSNLIKANSAVLPDELKDLGVCAYDENDFEEGILLISI